MRRWYAHPMKLKDYPVSLCVSLPDAPHDWPGAAGRVEASDCESGAHGRRLHCQIQLDVTAHCRLHRAHLCALVLATWGIECHGAYEHELYKTDIYVASADCLRSRTLSVEELPQWLVHLYVRHDESSNANRSSMEKREVILPPLSAVPCPSTHCLYAFLLQLQPLSLLRQ